MIQLTERVIDHVLKTKVIRTRSGWRGKDAHEIDGMKIDEGL
jgi:hypothetical protein